MNATVVGKTRLAPSLYTIDLRPDAPVSFRAGQYVELQFERPDGSTFKKHYSFASAPADPQLQLFVSSVEGADDHVPVVWPKPGARLSLGAVGGTLAFAATKRLPVMVATGTGIAPFLSMLRAGIIGESVLVHGVRTSQDLVFRDEIARHPQVRFIPVTSREDAPPGGLRGHVQDVLDPVRFTALTGKPLSATTCELFLCGLQAMMEDVAARMTGYTLHYDRYW